MERQSSAEVAKMDALRMEAASTSLHSNFSMVQQIKIIQQKNSKLRKESKSDSDMQPLDAIKHNTLKMIRHSENHRFAALKDLPVFSVLTDEQLKIVIQNMEEIHMHKGQVIVRQDDHGDTCFVVEDGNVVVTRKQNGRDQLEVPREVAQLGKGALFGEMSLVQSETRSATITVCSDRATLLKISKNVFETVINASKKINMDVQLQTAHNVIHSSCSLFKTLTDQQKDEIIHMMTPMKFGPESYICRQGKQGKQFFIIITGICKVVLNNKLGEKHRLESEQRQNEGEFRNEELGHAGLDKAYLGEVVGLLHPGDFFGEIALMTNSSKSTANVIACGDVTCMSLSRTDFLVMFKDLKHKMVEMRVQTSHQSSSSAGNDDAAGGLVNKSYITLKTCNKDPRRISGRDVYQKRLTGYVDTLLKRMAKFMAESIFFSLYHRMYCDMLLDPSRAVQFGTLAVDIMEEVKGRSQVVARIESVSRKILSKEPDVRSANEHKFIYGLMLQRNCFHDSLCGSQIPPAAFMQLCRTVRLVSVRAACNVVKHNSTGTCAFLIVKGAVRLLSEQFDSKTNKMKFVYKEDLSNGEYFGENALEGLHHREMTVQAITECDFITVEYDDFIAIQSQESLQYSVEEKFNFLSQIPVFRKWETYNVHRLAHLLKQADLDRGAIVMKKGEQSTALSFIVRGQVDIVTRIPTDDTAAAKMKTKITNPQNIITSLGEYEYFGESGLLQKMLYDDMIPKKSDGLPMFPTGHVFKECCTGIAAQRLELLVLTEENGHRIFEPSTLHHILSSFESKCAFRSARRKVCKYNMKLMMEAYGKGTVKVDPHMLNLNALDISFQSRPRKKMPSPKKKYSKRHQPPREREAGGSPELPNAFIALQDRGSRVEGDVDHPSLSDSYAFDNSTPWNNQQYPYRNESVNCDADFDDMSVFSQDDDALSITSNCSEFSMQSNSGSIQSTGGASRSSSMSLISSFPSDRVDLNRLITPVKYAPILMPLLEKPRKANSIAAIPLTGVSWTPDSYAREKMKPLDLETIPNLLNNGFDPLLVLATCRNQKEYKQQLKIMSELKASHTKNQMKQGPSQGNANVFDAAGISSSRTKSSVDEDIRRHLVSTDFSSSRATVAAAGLQTPISTPLPSIVSPPSLCVTEESFKEKDGPPLGGGQTLDPSIPLSPLPKIKHNKGYGVIDTRRLNADTAQPIYKTPLKGHR